ncbi:MAG: hypothetical protein AB7G11_09475 [Phycisphaerales bacterium]
MPRLTRNVRLTLASLGALAISALVGGAGFYALRPPPTGPFQDYPYTVLAYNDLGMHCMQQDFSELMILPPYNTLRAQVIDRTHGSPEIVTGGITVKYALPTNTHGADKTNFWAYAPQLLGVSLPPDIGLTGHGLSGSMVRMNPRDWGVTGIPLVPIDDSGRENPYPIATITVERNGQVVGKTQAVVPVSWEMSCQLCHNTPGISMATDILRAHDRLHNTTLEQQKPVFCAGCHMDNALGTPGVPGVPSLTSAMHAAHAPRMGMIHIDNECYACHPGVRTQCQRDVHAANGVSCIDCHGGMAAVGDPARNGWADEPRCADCHSRPGFEFEQPGVLFRDSVGHQGVKCIACHSSPHTITPATTPRDNLQAMQVQGHSGVINTCTVCHQTVPDDPFPHRVTE